MSTSYLRLCKYGCNTKIKWDTHLSKFVEEDGTVHDRDRCEGLRPGMQQHRQQEPVYRGPDADLVNQALKQSQTEVKIPPTAPIATNPIMTVTTVQLPKADWDKFIADFNKVIDLLTKVSHNTALMTEHYDGLVEQQRQLTRLLTKPLDENEGKRTHKDDKEKELVEQQKAAYLASLEQKAAQREAEYDRDKEDGTPWQ